MNPNKVLHISEVMDLMSTSTKQYLTKIGVYKDAD